MRWLRAGDIAPMQGQDPRDEKHRTNEAMARRAQTFKAVFATPMGEMVLQTILEASLFRAPVNDRLQEVEYLHYAQMRAGQNQLAATILAYIDHAEDLERQDHATQFDDDDRPPRDDGGWPGLDRGADPERQPDRAGRSGHADRAGGGAGEGSGDGAGWDIAVK